MYQGINSAGSKGNKNKYNMIIIFKEFLMIKMNILRNTLLIKYGFCVVIYYIIGNVKFWKNKSFPFELMT